MDFLGFEKLKRALFNRAYSDGGLDIDDVNLENVETNATINYTIDNVWYSKVATDEIDLSALTGLPTDALATGYTQVFALHLDSAGTFSITAGNQILTQNITDGDQVADFPGNEDAKCLVGYIKVGNASGSDFTLGTTSLGAAGITGTYYDVSGAVDNLDEL